MKKAIIIGATSGMAIHPYHFDRESERSLEALAIEQPAAA